MGERKGTNKYYPPDFDPAKHGSLNKYHHSHPLRERARKLAQGILVIRFEMPFNIWCDGCKNHIGMGVRYNAEKFKVGTYYTTPVYRFRMRCHLCGNVLELQTDPAGCDYVLVGGGRRKEERWDPRENQQLEPPAPGPPPDPMLLLDRARADRAVLAAAAPSLRRLRELRGRWRDDFGLNCRLRERFREEKQTLREEEEEAAALKAKAGLEIPLVREAEEDRRLAALLSYRSPASYEEQQKIKRSEISTRSWFPPATPAPGTRGGVLKKLGGLIWKGGGGVSAPHDNNNPPAATPPPQTPTQLGIVRRRAGEGSGGAERGETTPQTPPDPPGQGEVGGDTTPTAPPPPPAAPPPSLVADYSDSGSESP